jgi:hypothetical protein
LKANTSVLPLPSKEELQQKLVEWMGEQDGQEE